MNKQQLKNKVGSFLEDCGQKGINWFTAYKEFCDQNKITEEEFFTLWEEWAGRLTFETEDLTEAEVIAYQQGVIDCLEKLNIRYQYDESSPDLKQFIVQLK